MTPDKARLLVKLLTDADDHARLGHESGRHLYTVDFLEEVTRDV